MRHYINGVITCDCLGCRSARDHTIEEKVDEMQNKENKVEKKSNEVEIKKQEELEEIKKALRKLSSEELDDELLKIQEELDNMKKDKTDSKSASKSKNIELIGVDNSEAKGNYSVLVYNDISTVASREGDNLLIRLGSTD